MIHVGWPSTTWYLLHLEHMISEQGKDGWKTQVTSLHNHYSHDPDLTVREAGKYKETHELFGEHQMSLPHTVH